jgi:hypothetical protein
MPSPHITWRSRQSARLRIEALEARCLLSSYTFTKIADTSDGLSNFGEAPALNNGGTVAFLANAEAPGAGTCLYTGNGGKLTVIACTRQRDAQLDPFPSINDNGTAAVVLRSGQKESVLTGSGGSLTTLYSTQNALFVTFGAAALNNAGIVTFWAATPAESFPWIIFAGDGGPGNIIDHSDVFWFTQFGTFPSLNQGGTVAYLLLFRPAPPLEPFDSINIGDGQTITQLYSTQDGFFSSLGNPVVNDTSTVAFFATLTPSGSGIFAGAGGTVQTIATTGSVFSGFAAAPSLNNEGTVAFFATLMAGGDGIFTGPDAAVDKVIATGDVLNGSSVTELHFFRQELNDSGQVAFSARLADGTSGIYRADPANEISRPVDARAASEPNPKWVEPASITGIRSGELIQPIPSGVSLLSPQDGQTQVGQGLPVPLAVSTSHRATDPTLAGAHRAQPLEWASGFEVVLDEAAQGAYGVGAFNVGLTKECS